MRRANASIWRPSAIWAKTFKLTGLGAWVLTRRPVHRSWILTLGEKTDDGGGYVCPFLAVDQPVFGGDNGGSAQYCWISCSRLKTQPVIRNLL